MGNLPASTQLQPAIAEGSQACVPTANWACNSCLRLQTITVQAAGIAFKFPLNVFHIQSRSFSPLHSNSQYPSLFFTSSPPSSLSTGSLLTPVQSLRRGQSLIVLSRPIHWPPSCDKRYPTVYCVRCHKHRNPQRMFIRHMNYLFIYIA